MNDKIDKLIQAYLRGEISNAEKAILNNWVKMDSANRNYFKSKIKSYAVERGEDSFDYERAFQNFLNKKTKTIAIGVRRWIPYAAAILIISGLSLFLLVDTSGANEQRIVNTSDIESNKLQEQITITLADGTQQAIDKNSSSTVTDANGNVIANGSSGVLSFSTDNNGFQEPIFNEIYIPYGQKFQIQLTDGSKVWLNSGTRLKFIQNLGSTQGERRVVLDGEAFFEVAKNKERPFVVETNGMSIKVLGTKFNVNGYSTEGQKATTLVEGAVEVTNTKDDTDKMVLKPNDQALISNAAATIKKRIVDVEMFTAWMDNKLVVNNLTFEEIMLRLERTYNVDIQIKTEHLKQNIYKGEFENGDIGTVLSTIALSTNFNYNINANEVIITE